MIDSEWRQHWRILPPSIAGIILCATHGYSLGVMIVPLEQEFGWARAEISAGLFIISLVGLFVAPLAGTLIDRFGPRRIALIGVPFFCLALALLSTATANILTWWGLWALLAAASMLIIPTVWTAAINGFFSKKRGMALAIALSGTGITAATVPSLTNFLLQSYGWRGAYIGLGLIFITLVLPLVWFMFHPAGSRKAIAAQQESSLPPVQVNIGVSAREGFRSPSFLKLAGAVALFSVALPAITSNAVPLLMAQGMTSARAAGLAGLIGIGSITGRLVGGYLLDRFAANKVATLSVLLPIIAIVLLLTGPGSVLTASAACLIVGLAVGTEVDACAYLAARHFGLKSFGTLFGAINGLMLFGNGLAPILANLVFDVTRSYELVLWGMIPLCVATALLFYSMGSYPNFEGEKPKPAAH